MKGSYGIAAVLFSSILASHANAQTPAPGMRLEFPSLGNHRPITNIGRSLPVTRTAASARAGQMHVDDPSMRQGKTFDHSKTTNQNGLPTWTDSFAYQGLDFTYRMVGTDPKAGSQTTLIPTEIIPLRFVFPNGTVYDSSTDIVDGETAIQRIIESPIFQNYNFVVGGTFIGNTQYGDAFQRANFWNSVSTRSPDYHVLLGQPTILPTQTVIVPPDKDFSGIDPVTGLLQPRLDDDFLLGYQASLINQLNLSPRSLPIVLWGTVTGQFVAGIHPWQVTPNGPTAYIGTAYNQRTNGFNDFGADIYVLSHEIVEWMDDPFDGYTPGWNFAFDDPTPRCVSTLYDFLEVGDPLEIYRESEIPLHTSSFTYHVTDAVFVDFFTRSKRSRSVNGQYDLFGITLPDGRQVAGSPQCVGDIHLTPTQIDVPGSSATDAYGINNQGDVVGVFLDSASQGHGFLMQRGRFQTIDVPGSLGTAALGINEADEIVGNFFDGTAVHGFLYKNGRFQQIDFPGASNTFVRGINSAEAIVGAYSSSATETRGFVLQNRSFQTIVTHFGTNTDVNGINDLGSFVGSSWTPNVGQIGYVAGQTGISQRNMAGAIATAITAINDSEMKGGLFVDGTYFYEDGFIDLFGYLHEVNFNFDNSIFPLLVLGNNGQNQIVGITYDTSSLKEVGFVATLPIANRPGSDH